MRHGERCANRAEVTNSYLRGESNFVGYGGFPAFTTFISLNMVIQAPAQKLTIVGVIDEFLKFTLDNYYTNFTYANDRGEQVEQEKLVIEKMDFVFLATGIDQ